jgi:acetyl esterase/lipase
VIACGLLQVSDPGRFAHVQPPIGLPARDRIEEIAIGYLDGVDDTELADPLCVLEAREGPLALAPMFIPVGAVDPVLDDSRRLAAALARLRVPHELGVYAVGGHDFNTQLFRAQAQRCFEDGRRFLAAHARLAW